MKFTLGGRAAPFLFVAAIACGTVAAGAQGTAKPDAWNRVWQALQAPEPVPTDAAQDGPPVREGDRVLFRFRAPADVANVYLAGSFNAWARNNGGKIGDRRFALRPAGNGVWYAWVDLPPQIHRYKYVVERNGGFAWLPDPHVKEVDADGNTVLDFAKIDRAGAPQPREVPAAGRTLLPSVPPIARANAGAALDLRSEKVWVRPDQTNTLLVAVGQELYRPGARFDLRVETPFGGTVYRASLPCKSGENRLPVPALKHEGGFVARVTLTRSGRIVGEGRAVLSVISSVADDLRYGFYASFARTGGDYDARAAMLARLHVNAVEFYDYFPAHGYYAPREAQYRFEPFGTAIDARDIRQKIDAGQRRNLLSLAYVAAYAASESVYRQHPYPMTDASGIPKIFNGKIMTEAEADRQKKPKWFWLMNVAGDSPWHTYILDEFRRTLDDSPTDLVSFDGFEIDTYGDSADTRFYAPGSKRSGELLSDVLHDFVGDVQSLTHTVKPQGLVSFNSVNEFGVERMVDVTDFLFLEIWRGHTDNLGELVDICFRHRAPRRQRVVLKIYPADMEPGRSAWPESTLRRVLGATMTGAGSLMVVGEPDAEKGEMHALNTLYYPDHKPLSADNEALLRAYYAHDALLLGYTHGRNVINTDLRPAVPDCITRTYAAPGKRALVVQLLHVGQDRRWSVDVPAPTPRVNYEVALSLPGGVAPQSVSYASPDVPALRTPVKLDFAVAGGTLRVLLPELRVHGTLVLQY